MIRKIANPSGLFFSILLPLAALLIQWTFWPVIKPLVWFLFYPAVFFSARQGGLRGGLLATLLSIGIVWYFFLPPQLSWTIESPNNLYSVAVFLIMGYFFSDSQQRLNHANEQVIKALVETQASNETIKKLYEKTRELDKLKNQFFANISHELRTPLTLIIEPVERILAGAESETPARASLVVVLRNARLLLKHVNNLLDLAKLDADRMNIQLVPANLASTVRKMASHFESMAIDRSIQFTVNTPNALQAQVDAEKFERILLNLLSNAFKFTPDGGAIHVALDLSAGQIEIQVADSGPGVPEAMHESIFNRFTQVEGDQARSHGGTGLGLAIVREFVELMQGKVQVRKAPEGGALFTVCLPYLPPETTAEQDVEVEPVEQALAELYIDHARPRQAAASGPASAPLVLVVEDNPDMSDFLVEALRGDFRTATAANGHEGLEKAAQLLPDLIISDLMMNEMSGEEMVSRLRQQPAFQLVPVIILSARADDALRLHLLQDYVQDFIYKPFSAAELMARVRGLLSERQQRELRYRAPVEHVTDGVVLISVDGQIIYASPAVRRIFGFDQAAIYSVDPASQTHPDDLQHVQAELLKLIADPTYIPTLKYRFRHANGSYILIESTFTNLLNEPGVNAIVINFQDITERQKAQETLARSEEKYRNLAESMESIVATVDEAGFFHYMNLTARRYLGLSDVGIEGKNIRDLFPPEFAERNLATIRQVIASGVGEVYEREISVQGVLRWFHNSVQPIRSPDGKVNLAMVMGLEITERKEAERKLQQALQEKESLLREVHHRVKNNLYGVIGLIDIHRNQLQDPRFDIVMNELEGQARTMSLVYEQLYSSENLARVKMKDYLERLAASVVELFGHDRQVMISIDAAIDMDVAEAMPCGLIINELLTNTLKYAFPADYNGEPQINVWLEYIGQHCCLKIQDNGVGFPPGWTIKAPRSMGMRLVDMWVTHQLGGTIEISGPPGAIFNIQFAVRTAR